MADNSYNIEIVPASHNAWFTPAESNAYYSARYAREGVTIHWWGDGSGADNHDNMVNYFLGQGEAGEKSVNYVVSDNKITLMVNPDYVAWCSQGGNPTTISIEHQPTLGPEGYKKSGWLIEQLEQRYGHQLSIYPHSKWYGTSCPGTIDLNRIAQEVQKWRSGEYDQPPAPSPAPHQPTIVTEPYSATLYTRDNAKLVNIRDLSVVKTYPLDTMIQIAAKANYDERDFYLSAFAYGHNTNQGFLVGDLKDAPTPQPQPEPAPQPVPAPTPEPAPVPTPQPAPEPQPTPTPTPAPEPAPVPDTPATNSTNALKMAIAAVIGAIAGAVGAFIAWLHS